MPEIPVATETLSASVIGTALSIYSLGALPVCVSNWAREVL
jgi:hypothetical protein